MAFELVSVYFTKRNDFGHHCYHEETEATEIYFADNDEEERKDKLVKTSSCVRNLDTKPVLAQYTANTERKTFINQGMTHNEGGWPKDVDASEPANTQRFRKRVERDEGFTNSVSKIGPVILNCTKQNNTVSIYEDYFTGEIEDHSSEQPSASNIAKFQDPSDVRRSATSVDWHPSEGKIAVSYSILSFQDERIAKGLPTQSYIWDVSNPNTPDCTLNPSSPLCCLRFNAKQSGETLVGGCYNGLISFFDLRKGTSSPTETSTIEQSHHDPVYDVHWVQSKTGNTCVSVSTDGLMLWWDTRRLGEPVDRVELAAKQGDTTRILGGSCLEYNLEAGPTKYLVGTEDGSVLSLNTRARKGGASGITAFDYGAGKHHGPVVSIQRNPVHTKYFMTVGDWTARIWSDDGLKTPLLVTKYHEDYLTGGCWSPTRPGVFYLTRLDGRLDVWDMYYSQNECAFSKQVCNTQLTSIAISPASTGGRLVSVGDDNGTLYLYQVCESLAALQSNEKLAMGGMFDREGKRERNLEQRQKEMKKKMKKKAPKVTPEQEQEEAEKMQQMLRDVDTKFLDMIRKSEEDTTKSASS